MLGMRCCLLIFSDRLPQIIRRWPFCKDLSFGSTLIDLGRGAGGRIFTTGAGEEVMNRCQKMLTPVSSASCLRAR
eukprot:373294-Rhodomonas_salina.2